MAMAVTTVFQPPLSASAAMAGRKISVPVAVLADISPITRPRLVVNQRLAMVAPSTAAMLPVPMPETSPQVSIKCQGCVIHRLAAVEPDISASAPITVRLRPIRSIRAAANGPARP